MISIGFTGWQLLGMMLIAVMLGVIVGLVWDIIDHRRGTRCRL